MQIRKDIEKEYQNEVNDQKIFRQKSEKEIKLMKQKIENRILQITDDNDVDNIKEILSSLV